MELAHLTGDRQNVSLDFTWRESKFGSSIVELAHLTGDRQNVSLDFTWRESKFGSSMVELAHLTGDRQNVSLDLDKTKRLGLKLIPRFYSRSN